jgi:hypothetical protein
MRRKIQLGNKHQMKLKVLVGAVGQYFLAG